MTFLSSRRPVLALTAANCLLAGFLTGCIDPISLEVGEPERRLVVEGYVREGDGPHYVRLSRSASFTQGQEALRPMETGATVTLTAASGWEIPFPETMPGLYAPDPGTLTGEAGETYVLSVTLSDGTAYRSRPETMPASPGIARTFSELEDYVVLVGANAVTRQRVSLFVDANRTPDRTDYYRWMWTGTYTIQACYRPFGQMGEFCETCYRPLDGNIGVRTGSDLGASGSVLPRQRAVDIPLQDRVSLPSGPGQMPIMKGWAIVGGLHLQLEQQALSAETYNFWDRLRRQTEDAGSLFDPPPENLPGNVFPVDDPSQPALGYFSVVGSSRVSTCLRRNDFPGFPSLGGDGVVNDRPCHQVGGTTTPPPGYAAACSLPS